MHYPKRTPEKALGEGKIVNIGFVEDLKKRTQSVYEQEDWELRSLMSQLDVN